MNRIILILVLNIVFSFSMLAQVDHWETTLYADGTWKYFLGNEAPPNDWASPFFNDTSWEEGVGGIGYGDGDDNTIIPPVVSLFSRQKFQAVDLDKIELAVVHADYDDAFVAYINGVEIARSNNINGNPPEYDDEANDLHEAVLYEGGFPESFILEKSQLEQLLVEGENTFAVQIHNYEGLVSSDLTSLFWISFGINDASNDYGPVPSWFVSPVFFSHLPIVKINTNGGEIVNEPPIPAVMEIVWNGAGQLNSSIGEGNELTSDISIEYRGQSSLALFPKKNFAIETKDEFGEDMDTSFLNFPAEEDWILHGPYSDKTLLRNVLTMELARQMGQYASRTRFVEVMVNGSYEGIYVMMEKIKQDDNRVNVADLNIDDIEGDELTGGYVFKVDKDEFDWVSSFDVANNPGVKLQYQYVSPKKSKIQPEQEAYIQAYVDYFEQALKSNDLSFQGMRYDEFIDINSFAEHFVLTELSRDVDGFRLSTYFHKKKESNGGKIYSGPVWDYNLGWANADYCGSPSVEGWMYNEPTCQGGTPFWWEVMLGDAVFTRLLKCRYDELREGPFHLDSIFAFIDEKTELLNPSIERNYDRWPILDEYIWPNSGVYFTYEGEVEVMKNWIAGRLDWMDDNMIGNCSAAANENVLLDNEINISPNPTADFVRLDFPENISGEFDFKLFDVFGETILVDKNKSTTESNEINVKGVNSGNYYLMINSNGNTWVEKVVVLK